MSSKAPSHSNSRTVPTLTVRAGEAMVEPPNVAMIGHNPSATEPTKVVIFYVGTPDTPFLDPLHH